MIDRMGTKDAALYLGVSTKTIDRMVTAGEIESYKIGRLRKIDKSALDAYVERQKQKAVSEQSSRTQTT